ncbi:hypothetical protein [Paraburkholderia sp. 32]|uniref:hypothetical protein n=1 Tax=Paraburkholderia sp. 32 TaxID=2991057 RepID=UPI003D1F6D3D
MKHSLSIAKGPKQRLFLAYLNSEFAKRAVRCQAALEITADGSFKARVHTVFGEDFGQIELQWVFDTSSTGELLSVDVSPVGEGIDGPAVDWENAAQDVVNSAFRSAFNERRTRTVRRQLLYYIGPQLDGEYWFRDVRLAPAMLDDPSPVSINSERVVALDFVVDSIDELDALYLASEFSRRWAARFSLLLDVDLYELHAAEQVWVYRPEVSRSERLQRGVYDIPVRLTIMPRKGSMFGAGARGSPIATYGRTTGTLKMPPEARRVLRGLDDLAEPVKNAFDGAARLYQIGLSLLQRFPSAALAYRVAAIDALQQTEAGCNGFSEFMRKYSPKAAADPKVLDYLHSDIRSSHFHAGKFDLGEFSAQRHLDIVTDPDTAHHSRLRSLCFEITREALVNWMLLIAAPPCS